MAWILREPPANKSLSATIPKGLKVQDVAGPYQRLAAASLFDRRSHEFGLHATLVLATVVYALALVGSALLDVRASVLDSVPIWLGLAAFFSFYSRVISPPAALVAGWLRVAAIVVVLGLSLACLSYIGAILGLPLRDQEVIWADRHLGLDWLAIMSGLDRWPRLLKLLDLAYATFTSQLIAVVIILLVARRMRDLDRFFVTFVCTSLIAELASVLIPTLGPMTALAANAQFINLPTLGRTTGEIVLALRHGTLTAINLEAIDGIISFPSLHAAVAVLVPYTLRWSKVLFWPVALLDGTMLVSSVPCGNHYFIDIVGGLAAAGLGIFCGRHLQTALDGLTAGASKSEFAVLLTATLRRPYQSVFRPMDHLRRCLRLRPADERATCKPDRGAGNVPSRRTASM